MHLFQTIVLPKLGKLDDPHSGRPCLKVNYSDNLNRSNPSHHSTPTAHVSRKRKRSLFCCCQEQPNIYGMCDGVGGLWNGIEEPEAWMQIDTQKEWATQEVGDSITKRRRYTCTEVAEGAIETQRQTGKDRQCGGMEEIRQTERQHNIRTDRPRHRYINRQQGRQLQKQTDTALAADWQR